MSVSVRISSLLCCLVAVLCVGLTCADYWEDRTRFIDDERNMILGAEIKLSERESAVNDILMKAKRKEFLAGFLKNDGSFPPAKHFFHAMKLIDESEVFKILQKMPKGAMLHGHDKAMASTDFLITNLTYRDHLYACVDSRSIFRFHFFQSPDDKCNWTLLSDMRNASENVSEFDIWLGKKLHLVVPNPEEVYPNINGVWSAFTMIFKTIRGLLTFRPVFEDYLNQVLTEFYEDNVMYIEFRSSLKGFYELNGTELDSREIATIFNNVVKRFSHTRPRFLGAKVIYSPFRKTNKTSLLEHLDLYKTVRNALPNFMAGFDLVGQEDVGHPLENHVETLLEFQRQGVDFFFHAGETNWQGETDMNIIDAILLNATRIGHGYALTKHPLALKMVKERGIAIEVNPISNQVLMLVKDLRNHPAVALIADNYPIVISSDDPSFWGAKGLSYDFYVAFMGLSGLHADIRVLKKLAINSLQYSAMSVDEKASALEAFHRAWEVFVSEMIQSVETTSKRQGLNATQSELHRIIRPIGAF